MKPRRHLTLLGIAAAVLAIVTGCSTTSPPPKNTAATPAAGTTPAAGAPIKPDPINPTVNNCNITSPDTPITAPLLTSGLPCAANITAPITLDNIQRGFDYYSWLTFLALNSPANGTTPIGKGSGAGGDAPAIWEQWKELSDVMLPDGSKPPPWNAARDIPKACRGLDPQARVLRMVGKTPDLLSETVQPFDTGPLIDQHGRYARYEILVNRPMFEYILANGLYSKKGQAAFTAAVMFPEGAVTKITTGTIGAIMVKASWKILDASDDATHFHSANALVYTPPQDNPKIAESCHKATLGLVGLHIAHKTANEPQWIWSTFEQGDNAPQQSAVDAKQLKPRYNFYKTGCGSSACLVNMPPPRPWNPNIEPFPNGFTSQITRVLPITDEVAQLTASFTGLLKGSIWQNYILVSTQWPTDATSKVDPNGVPAPVFLANSTLETYIQGTVPQASSSCMACHGNAAATSGRQSDFTYVLERAK